ncbi:hypothetical protein ECH_0256 [Ehrlichia chaffeensis str. Arkansas]|uniref:Uncharacterized protein n=1 Tax=Ehrlichia chaffeensis (strain ATCC CRL-10679 / Arkansas) TaxID=205920 RepID=Q2GHK6_EHRCR|nr:hypothetical protein ECH_0256 [Ehrlichia chaffeensis str. Arkansas]
MTMMIQTTNSPPPPSSQPEGPILRTPHSHTTDQNNESDIFASSDEDEHEEISTVLQAVNTQRYHDNRASKSQ